MPLAITVTVTTRGLGGPVAGLLTDGFGWAATRRTSPTQFRSTSTRIGPDPSAAVSTRFGLDPVFVTSTRRGPDPSRATSEPA